MRIVWSKTAERSIDRIFDYISKDSPAAAEDVAEAIIGAADSLGDTPQRNRDRGNGRRHQLVLGTRFFIRYKIKRDRSGENYVAIIAIRHGAQERAPS
jgi:plasmid stabilization system protein ParE